jgi:type IV pilus assembly protein PilA
MISPSNGVIRMRDLQTPRQQCVRRLLHGLLVTGLTCLLFSSGAAQTTTESPSQISPDDLKKLSGLFTQFGSLLQKMQAHVEPPAPRNQSRLLALLPASTLVYMAVPNYGEASHQALTVFQEQLKDNAQLRAWWEQGDISTQGSKMVENLEKFYQLSQYLGEEVVISAASSGKEDPRFLALAAVRKPGLKDFLRQALKEFAGKSKPIVRVFDAAELAAAKDVPSDQRVILVLPDLVVMADLGTLRKFNARPEPATKNLASTEFGQRLVQGYEGGATIVGGVDFERIFKLSSTTLQNDPTFQRSGFSDMKYLVIEHKNVGGQAASQMELTFTGPRRGVASWIAASGPMGSLDFVSPKALMAFAVHLKNPAEMFDEVKDLATASNPMAFASVARLEEGLRLSLRDDLLGYLGGEIAVEMDHLTPPLPAWKVILKSNDPAKISATLRVILAAAHLSAKLFEEDGLTYHMVRIPAGQKTTEIGYVFVDGYLVVAPSHDALIEAVRLHRSGESLAKNQKFLASLPPGTSAEASALLYEDPVAMAALSVRRASPEMAEIFSNLTTETDPVVVGAYGEDNVLREVSRGGRIDAGAMLVGAAIVIPNLLRARIAANESSSVATLRTANTAQITYANTYPERGYAPDLATLGPDPLQASTPSRDHASFIDAALGNPTCTAGAWCTKSGFQFTMVSACKKRKCDEYVVVGTLVSTSTGARSFCSTSEAVIRFKGGPPLTSPVSASECQTWSPLQ